MKFATNTTSFWVVIAFGFFILLLLFTGSHVNEVLRYSRSEILGGQVWRLFTGHIVHLGFVHGVLNTLAFFIIIIAMGHYLRLVLWLVAGVAIGLFISLCLLVFSENVVWYVGFSGVLHGLLTLVLLVSVVTTRDKLHAVAIVLVIAKVVREQLPSFDIYHMENYIRGAVVVDAHLYGVIGGGVLAVAMLAQKYFTKTSHVNPSSTTNENPET